jgi:hypothetical protein
MALLCGKFGFLLTGWLTFITSALTAGTGEISGILDRNHQLSKLFQQTVVLNLDASIRRLILVSACTTRAPAALEWL